MSLEEHIDTPIKKSVVGLALLGYKPIFSCCGFSYKDEKTQKTHLDRPYIYLDYNSMAPNQVANLVSICRKTGWSFSFAGQDIINIQGRCFSPDHPWSKQNCPHYSEQHVMSICALENFIVSLAEHFCEKTVIVDGNKKYKEDYNLKYWQYEESEDWEITPALFQAL